MSDYELMQETVDQLCKDMETRSALFIVGITTFNRLGSNIKYWISLGENPIIEIWDGDATHKVFSTKQGVQIRKSFNKMRELQASSLQKKVIADNAPQKPIPPTVEYHKDHIPWWKKLFGG